MRIRLDNLRKKREIVPDDRRVAVVTMPLYDNQGGLLQCFALSKFISGLGYEPVVFDKMYFYQGWRKLVYRVLCLIPGQDIRGIRSRYLKSLRQRRFIDTHLLATDWLMSAEAVKEVYEAYRPSKVVAGSDQVWRFSYINDSYWDFYFLSFAEESKKVSYAASFGKDIWESSALIPEVKGYLSKFSHISVREKSGISLCRDVFAITDAVNTVDPTLLLDADDYIKEFKIKDADGVKDGSTGKIVTYILDFNEFKRACNALVAEARGESVLELNSGINKLELTADKWVEAISRASFVVTDSFHGMVFSIIFRKRFIAIVNPSRGSERFYSLATALGLESNLVIEGETLKDISKFDVDYDEVEKKLEEFVRFSREYLKKALK